MEKGFGLLDKIKNLLQTPDRMSHEDHFKKHLAEDVFVPISNDHKAELGDRLISFRDGEYLSKGFVDQNFELSKGAKIFLWTDVNDISDSISEDSIAYTKNPIFFNLKVGEGKTEDGLKYIEYQGHKIASLDTSGEIWPAKEVININRTILDTIK